MRDDIERLIEIEADADAERIMDETTTATAVAIRDERDRSLAPANVLPSPVEWEATMALARTIAATTFVPEAYRGQPEAVVAAILTGRELGIGPMQALREIHMIDGRAAFSATLMLAQMRRRGLMIVDSESTPTRAWIHARRSDTGEAAEVEWTIEEAEAISRRGKPLTSGDNWRNYPADMLWARAVGRLARRLGGDLLGGLHYAAEEVRDFDDGDAGGYGGGAGYEAAARDVQPWKDLLPGAVKVTDVDSCAAVRYGQERLYPRLDWASVEESAGVFAEKGKAQAQWSAAAWGRHWNRLANAVVRAQDLAGGGDFPPPSEEQIVEAYEWAFDGYVIPAEAFDVDDVDATGGPESDEPEPTSTDKGEGVADPEEANESAGEGDSG